MENKAIKMKASRLVMDFDIYPRASVDSYHVSRMLDTLDAGGKLPPVLADKKSKRIADGFHRIKAMQRKFGPDAEMEVILKSYASEGELFLDAMTLNSAHGRSLTVYDKSRAITIAEGLNLSADLIAGALRMTATRIGELKANRIGEFKSGLVALKRTTAHLAGTELTQAQKDYNVKAGGMHQSFYVNQVTLLLESDSFDWEHAESVKALNKLYKILEGLLSKS